MNFQAKKSEELKNVSAKLSLLGHGTAPISPNRLEQLDVVLLTIKGQFNQL